MNFGKWVKGILCCLMILSAFYVNAYCMDFDAETAYESIFVVRSGNHEGSGFAIGTNMVVTNAHVIGNQKNIILQSYDGHEYRAGIYLIDNTFDIAILSVENADFVPLEIGNSDELKVGDDIYAIGTPNNMEYTLTKGVVSSLNRKIGSYKYIQIDAAINSGNSGGPLLTDDGKVVGVNSLKVSDAEGIGLAIPITDVVTFIRNNGIVINDKNVVDGEIPFIPEKDSKDKSKDKKEAYSLTDSSDSMITFLLILLCISVALNVILIILLFYRNNKNIERVPEASERTDFEIDILE